MWCKEGFLLSAHGTLLMPGSDENQQKKDAQSP